MPRNDLLPGIALVDRRLADLTPARRRLRKSDHAHIEARCRSISAFGFCVPVLINTDGTVVDGHIRIEAARRLGLETIPCILVDHLSEEELRLLSISLNRLAENGEWNLEELGIELAELQVLNMDLTLTGFDDIELDVLLQSAVESDDPDGDAVKDVHDAAPTSVPGDLWRLGEHRLLCGDATDTESYAALMRNECARMVFSGPPYNIRIKGFVSGLGKIKHEDSALGCGEMSPAQFRIFLGQYLDLCQQSILPGSVIYVCMDWRHSHDLVLAAQDTQLNLIQMCVWDKGSGAMGSLYRNAYELIHIYCAETKPATNNIELGKSGRDRTNVQHYPGANRKGSSAAEALKLHATPKPVELVEDFILDVTKRGDIVLDPFVGSGTTIIAAEICGRRAYCIEIDPKFVDRTIRRWESRTGQKAIHETSGLTLEELADERTEDLDTE
ncbi:site-specific DNA-methyltransferase [Sphingosinicella microcystinivorans]|nr:site-specific DNA-methyltransferase [Sphingosinicella microcystinivorans]WBX86456.1 site-specific DNA-methyltransferase [Sphingosinicella microcystinivorans]